MKYYRRRKVFKKKPWYRKKYNAIQLAYKAWRGVRRIRGLVNSEMLHVDKTYSSNTISGTGYVYNLTGIAQGDGINQRTGNSILVRNLTYRLKFEINSSVTADTTILFALVWDTQQVGDTSPAITDIFASATPETLLATGTLGRFKIILRKHILLTPASGGKPAIVMHNNLNLYKHTRYNGVNDTDIQRNGLYLVMVSSESTNLPTITGTVRLGYHDN